MKCLVFKGSAPFVLRGAWGELTIEANGVITRCDVAKWEQAYKQFKSVFDDFIASGHLVINETNDKEKYRDGDVESDNMSDELSKQNQNRSGSIQDEHIPTEKSKDRQRVEAKASELGIKFDDKTTTTELKNKITEALGNK